LKILKYQTMAEETCANCGNTIGKLQTAYIFNDKIVCHKCNLILQNEKIGDNQTTANLTNSASAQNIKCPRCGSAQINIDKKGFSAGKSVGFGLLLGPIGVLSGFHKSKKILMTCLACGNTWTPGENV